MGLRTLLGLKKPKPKRPIPPIATAQAQKRSSPNASLLTLPPELAAVLDGMRSTPYTLVQIGAYVGTSDNDPIAQFLKETLAVDRGATAVLVEPVREYFDALKANYAGLQGVRFENVAIAETAGERDFYRIRVDPTLYGHPAFLSQLGSLKFDRMTRIWDRVEGRWKDRSMREFYLQHRVVEKVPCLTFDQLLRKHGISQIDLLQIDTEGYDFEILKSIDFAAIRPRFVNYERLLLLEDEAECRRMMESYGYALSHSFYDTLCTRV